ncbi:MAG TPA: divergent polysaccharide deacetylase family protein [Candidatus Baltobacteraceae bacterium]|nr:divergent polysaccharide deacetylase family protein [Candidatus Baltobacteraceae bacterium]
MARRRKRSNGSLSPLLIFLLGLLVGILGFVALKFVFGPPPAHQPVAVGTPAPSEEPEVTTSPSPLSVASPSAGATALASPSPASEISPGVQGGHLLAIIIDDCGQWPVVERAMIALPVPLTLSVMPDAPYTRTISREADAAGKGVMLHLPMEPISEIDPGPGKITTAMSDDAIIAQVTEDLAHVSAAHGVNNHEGSKATQDVRVMHDVLSVLARENKFFIDSMTIGASVGATTAHEMGVPTAKRDVFLDNRAEIAYSEGQLEQAARIALQRGSAIAIGHPRPTTLAALRAMIPQLQAEGVQFTLVEHLVR